ncbi:LuxR C-terminal-related transcriptional regulator [Miltoncostaea oceani]|uniref:LuxR C-terminal-related transcriptional regulator n=1 Tax=Miltoncostaea oceani TaxID=2843216 RepID=UPI001C3DD6F5|nr:LuxR C-terminal-related transcriptional regulator [Miltoncostaea oceani]
MPPRTTMPPRFPAPVDPPGAGIPAPVPDEITRSALLARLDRATTGLVLVSAPAGYGKTTLLAQMARAAATPVAWLTLRPAHRAPRRLEADLAAALTAVAPGRRQPFLLVIDDVDVLTSRRALAAVEGLAAGLPEGSRVALGCRADPGLLLGRRQVEGAVLRITAEDLAFDEAEVAALMAAAGIDLGPGELVAVADGTEGWPAGLRLAAVRIGGHPRPPEAARSFAGDDRLVADYLHEVMLDDLAPEVRTFLMRTSVLEPLSGDLCDAVLGTTGSATRLLGLERSNLLLVVLDDHGESYRYHHLLGDLLRRELRRCEPGEVAGLHDRASRWHAAAGDAERAVRHALAAGDSPGAVGMLWRAFPGALTRGGIGTLQAMLARFGVDEVVASAPLAVASAWCYAETRGDLAAHCLSLAERVPVPPGAEAPDGLAPAATALRALLARDGIGAMARTAAEGFRTAPDDGPWRAYHRFLEGVARHLAGDPVRARVLLEDGVERAGRVAPSVHALCLAQLALLLLAEDEPVRGLMMARRSRAVIAEWGLGSQGSAALGYSALALALAVSGHPDEARENIREARRVLSATVDASAWLAVEVRVAMARAGLAIGDDGVAEEAMSEADRFRGQLGDAPLLRDEVEELARRVQPVPEGDAACLSSITAAETRVLRLLPTHHSVREIGDLLFLSRFTVKSHAHSLYRKLGVSCRSEAVERARQLRILPPAGGGPPAARRREGAVLRGRA